jgi:predicted phosphodiesterase
MRFLITSDIHLTDNPRDAYRFGLFSWLRKQQLEHQTNATLVLGDLTDHKDRHSSVLVNKTVEGFKSLIPPVFILRGNHDCIRQDLPFFKFLNEIHGLKFCTDITLIDGYKLAFIPHQLNQDAFNNAFKQVPSGWVAFTHQTITGAISETGQQLTGFTVPPNKAKAIYSGDIHVPHKCGQVTYIGAPYHIHHGDAFKPRVLLLDEGTENNLYFAAPKKLHLHIRDVSEIPELHEGDQVKITLELTPAELVEWSNHKKTVLDHCQQRGVEVYGVILKKSERRKRERLNDPGIAKSKLQYFSLFCDAENLAKQIREAGFSLLGGHDAER